MEEEAERKKNEAIAEYQAQQAIDEGDAVEDHSALSKVLHGLSRASLAIIMGLAVMVMFWSPEMGVYEKNRAIFYTWGFVFTIVYFVSAYWTLRRTKALNPHH